jgi:hypothetical protein
MHVVLCASFASPFCCFVSVASESESAMLMREHATGNMLLCNGLRPHFKPHVYCADLNVRFCGRGARAGRSSICLACALLATCRAMSTFLSGVWLCVGGHAHGAAPPERGLVCVLELASGGDTGGRDVTNTGVWLLPSGL